jgi:putative ABC transport system substrate-binding protein
MTNRANTLMTTIAIVACLLLAPLSAVAQQAGKVYRIGYLHQGHRTKADSRISGFRQGLRDVGYVEGQNITVEYRFANGRRARLAKLAAELAGMRLDVIVAATTPSTRALKRATTTIPIVMVAGSDPVANGLVASFQRPGANITGVTRLSGRLNVKRLELLKETFPKIRRVGVLWWQGGRGRPNAFFRTAQGVAQSLGLELQRLKVQRAGDLQKAFEQMGITGTDALITLPSPISRYRKQIVDFTSKRRLPAMFSYRIFVDVGGLMYYGANIPDITRRVAYYVDKILKGAKPADMPVERPTKFDFVINLKTARALGITIPPSILLRATEVIE